MSTEATIRQKLEAGLDIDFLDISNESHMHNVPEGSESHFRVVVVSEAFADQTLIKRHRVVNAILKEELADKIHALALHTFTAQEWQDRGESAQLSPECRGGSKR